MALLVLARAIQGLAGGGLNALGFAAAAAYPEALRLRMFSLISGVWGVLALGAPLLGGLITDTLGWRWIFLVNVPLCALVAAARLVEHCHGAASSRVAGRCRSCARCCSRSRSAD